MKIFMLVGGLLILPMLMVGQVQIGQTFTGESGDARAGTNVAMSADGSIIAYSEPAFGNIGRVRIYQNIAGAWQQMGDDIMGEGADDFFGGISESNEFRQLALSDDGLTVVISSPNHADFDGYIKVYDWNGQAWNQVFNTLRGDGGSLGFDLATNSDASTIVTLEVINNTSRVITFERGNNSWVPYDTVAGFQFEELNMDLSADGSTLVVGAQISEDILTYSRSSNGWVQSAPTLSDEYSTGTSLAIAGDGQSLVVGSQVFQLVNNIWMQQQQLGALLFGQPAFSFNAEVLAGSSISCGNSSQGFSVYKKLLTQWELATGGDCSVLGGWASDVSSDGNYMIFGNSREFLNGSNGTGVVRVYDLTLALPIRLTAFTAVPEQKSVALSWQTASESQNAGFHLQHSTDGQS